MDCHSLKCQFNECGSILEKPVALPCGHTLCLEHLNANETKFKCFLCNEEHLIPKNGFRVNKTIEQIVERYHQSDPMRKRIKASFDELNESFKEYEDIDLDVYVYDYFADIRNKVDLHRDELIKVIVERSEEILKQLKEKEEKCKSNRVKIDKINIKFDKLDYWKREMKKAEINENELSQFFDEMNFKKDEIDYKIKQIKNKLLLNESINFEKIENSSLFGDLEVKSNDFVLSKYCGKLIRVFNQHTDTVTSIQVDEESNKIISASNDKTIKIWTGLSGKRFH